MHNVTPDVLFSKARLQYIPDIKEAAVEIMNELKEMEKLKENVEVAAFAERLCRVRELIRTIKEGT